ncbi:hypothetical protein ACS0TY_004186 [Phlomoides rotata]
MPMNVLLKNERLGLQNRIEKKKAYLEELEDQVLLSGFLHEFSNKGYLNQRLMASILLLDQDGLKDLSVPGAGASLKIEKKKIIVSSIFWT